MKCFYVLTLLVIVLQLASCKTVEKGPIKKASSAKPTKHRKSILEEFSGLSQDDTDFIKELDKQFKVHGEKIKIKVEKENVTTSKNSKRTIDGSLGYGYQQPEPQQGFFFSQPKFMVYPYSQHDIPPRYPHDTIGLGGLHHFPTIQSQLHTAVQFPVKTSVSVHQSQGFQIQDPGQAAYSGYPAGGHSYHEHQSPDAVPVIVLRIPGPHKYAAHLQNLLQRYLELRAAQYIAELEQQESHGHIEQQEHQIAHHEQQYAGPRYLPKGSSTVGPEDTGPQVYPSAEPEHFAVTSYQTVPSQPIYEDHQIIQQNQDAQVEYQQHQEAEVDYESSSVATLGQRQNYEQQLRQQQEQEHQQRHQQQQLVYEEHQTQLETSENYPSNKHTQVLFSHIPQILRPVHQLTYQPHHQQQYRQYPQHQHQHQHQHELQHHQQPQIEYEPEIQVTQQPLTHAQGYQQPYEYYRPQETEFTSEVAMVSITPKHRHYNYHAHPVQHFDAHASASTVSPKTAKRDTPYTEEQFKKFNKIINRMRKKNYAPTRTNQKQ